jgi:signal transduction histidine kinase
MKKERATSPQAPDYIWHYRLLAMVMGLNMPFFRLLLPADAVDPMWLRWVLCGGIMATVAYSFFFRLNQRQMIRFAYAFVVVVPSWMLWLAWLNHLMPEYVGAYFLTSFGCSLMFRNVRHLLTYGVFQLLILGLVLATVTDPLFSPLLMGMLVMTFMAVAATTTAYNVFESKKLEAIGDLQRTITSAAFENSPDGLLVTSVEGYVLHFNQRLLDMWGMTADDLSPHVQRAGMTHIRPALANPQVLDESHQRAQANPSAELSDELITRDGRHIIRSSKPIGEGGKDIGRIWFFTDVTATRKEEAELKLNRKKLHRQNQALVRLASHPAIQAGHLQQAFEAIAQVITQVLEVERTGVWLLDGTRERLNRAVLMDADGRRAEAPFVIKASTSPLYFKSIETERVLAIENTSIDPRTAPFVGITGNERIHATLDVPIRHEGKVIGIVCAETLYGTRIWSDDEQNFMVSVGDLLTIALHTEARVHAEKAQNKSLGVIRALLQQGGIGVLITDLNREVLEYNQKYLEFWNMSEQFLLNNGADTVIEFCQAQTHDPIELRKTVDSIMENPVNEQCDLIYFKNGRVLERQTTPVGAEGAIFARAWIYRDITARVQAEQQLLASERRNQAFVNAIPDLILRLDAQLAVIDHKLPPQHEFGDWVKGIRGGNLHQLFPSELTQSAEAALSAALETGRASDFQIEMNIGRGVRDYEIRIVAAGQQEFLLLLRDITERKHTEKELLQRNFELDSFVYRASHDLKAPLNSLMGLIEITRSETVEDNTKKYLHMMDKSVVKLDTFIRNLTDFSRIARSEHHLEPVDLRQMIDEILESLRYMEHAERVEKRVLIPPGTVLRTDPLYLGVVITNLLSNAIKYQDFHRQTSWLSISLAVVADFAVIQVEDNGVGIPLEHHSRIFNLFFRASNQSFGSGIGLYITRNTAQKLGGSLDFSSKPGEGTTFTLRLPMHQVATVV